MCRATAGRARRELQSARFAAPGATHKLVCECFADRLVLCRK